VRTYPVHMNVTLSIDDDLVIKARRKAEAAGTSFNQVLREHVREYVGEADPAAAISEFLSIPANGNSRGWRFNREELHERG
jgi:hypothetical protein